MTVSGSHKALNGIIWTSVQKFGSMILSMGSNIILARMLTPTDFGIVGIMMVFINLSNVFIEGGFGSALIQKKNPTEIDYSTVFYWNLFLSIILYLILWYCSPLIADFYNIDKLSGVLKLLGLVLISNSFSLIQTTKLRKNLNFKIPAITFVIASVFALTGTIILAYKGFGIWSLVFFQICQSATNTFLLWIFAKWYPLLKFSWESFKNLFNYGSYLLFSTLLSSLGVQLQSLYIGKICSPSTLGYYTQAKNLEQAPTNVIYSVVGQVAFPIFSSYQNDLRKMSDICNKMTTCVSFFIIPLMFLLIILAKPLIILILSSKWIPAVPYFQMLCLAGIATSLDNINYYAIAASGASKLIFNWSLIKNIITIGLISLGILWDIYGILIAVVLSSYINYFINIILIKKELHNKIWDQIKHIIPSYIISFLLIVIFLFFIKKYDLNLYVGAVLFIIMYFVISYILKFKALSLSYLTIKNYVKNKNI